MKNNISELTNSEVGSVHWFNTLTGFNNRVSEFIVTHAGNVDNRLLVKWSEQIISHNKELFEFYNPKTK